MRRILERNPMNSTGTILRLAWLQGLMREEITYLTWDQVSFLDRRIRLPDREAPMEEEMLTYLQALYDQRDDGIPYVVCSERFRKRMLPQAISRIARKALDGEGQTAVRLVDLRHDYIIRQLASHDCGYVSRITGVEIRSLQTHFSQYMKTDGRARKTRGETEIDEFRLWKILQAEKNTPAGLALWLTWQMGLSGGEIIALTWDQVDFPQNVIRLPDREVPLTSSVSRLLEEARARGEGETHVLLSERARKPMDMARLSRAARAALIRGGLENLTLKDLRRDSARSREESLLLDAMDQRGSVTRREASELLNVSRTAAYARLRRLVDDKKAVLIGARYYPAGQVVPPEEQRQAIRDYLLREGFAYRQDIARVLNIQHRQCSLILKHMVEDGELVRISQKYYLNLQEEA